MQIALFQAGQVEPLEPSGNIVRLFVSCRVRLASREPEVYAMSAMFGYYLRRVDQRYG